MPYRKNLDHADLSVLYIAENTIVTNTKTVDAHE